MSYTFNIKNKINAKMILNLSLNLYYKIHKQKKALNLI